MLPNLVIIGAMKAGTTSLFAYLRTHPQIFMAQPKELDFFNQHWDQGRSWYEEKFEEAGGAKVVGEASPYYTKAHLWEDTSQRMASLIPDAKLIYSLRDPVERIRSHYLHHVADGTEDRSFQRALSEERDPRTRDYFQTSDYAFQLEYYLESFPRDQVLTITAERLRDSRLATLQKIFRFLEVDDQWVPPKLAWEAHRTDRKVIRHPLTKGLREQYWYRAILRRTPLLLKKVGHRITTRRLEAPMSDQLREQLRERLRPEVGRLRIFIDDPDFDGWGIA